MWKTIEIPPMHFVRSLRVQFGRCNDGFHKQVGLRRLRDAARIANSDREVAFILIREAGLALEYAKATDEREAARRA